MKTESRAKLLWRGPKIIPPGTVLGLFVFLQSPCAGGCTWKLHPLLEQSTAPAAPRRGGTTQARLWLESASPDSLAGPGALSELPSGRWWPHSGRDLSSSAVPWLSLMDFSKATVTLLMKVLAHHSLLLPALKGTA